MAKRTKKRTKLEEKISTIAIEIPPQSASAMLTGPGTLLSVRELSRHLRVSRQTIRRLVMSGQIPYARVGRQLRFDLMAVRGVVDKHR